jgi:hypothetical protein
MPKQIITTRTATAGGIISQSVVFWYPVPAGKEVPKDLAGSAFKGATQTEIDALKAGTVIEEVETIRVPKSFSAAQIKGVLVAWWTDRKAFLDTNPPEGQYYATFYDGTWSA